MFLIILDVYPLLCFCGYSSWFLLPRIYATAYAKPKKHVWKWLGQLLYVVNTPWDHLDRRGFEQKKLLIAIVHPFFNFLNIHKSCNSEKKIEREKKYLSLNQFVTKIGWKVPWIYQSLLPCFKRMMHKFERDANATQNTYNCHIKLDFLVYCWFYKECYKTFVPLQKTFNQPT